MGLRNYIGLGIFLGLYFVRFRYFVNFNQIKKQPSRGVLRKRCRENMLQIYRRTPMPKCELWHGFSPVNLQYIFRTPFPKKTSGRMFLEIVL